MMTEPTKRCPFCGEAILAVAIKCKHCGSNIAPDASPPPVPPANKAPYLPTEHSVRNSVVLGIGFGVVVLCAVAYGVTKEPTMASAVTPPGTKPYKIGEDQPNTTWSRETEKPKTKTALEEILELSAVSAFAYARPSMTDTFNQHSKGTFLLAAWALQRMRWSDVFVENDETTHALVLKDPDEQRGRRMCIGGTIVQIETDKSLGSPVYAGLLQSYAGNLYSFLAVGSTGSLVAQSDARVCGIVTGKFDYANSMGGTGHAVDMVGMFQLPANVRK